MSQQTAENKTTHVYSLDGSVKEEIAVPAVFSNDVRPDLIRRAVNSILTANIQPKSRDPMAGKKNSAVSLGVGLDLARVPRVKGGGPAAFAPCVVGGRVAFPERVEKIYHERINRKERLVAVKSAIAATAAKDIVLKRGHIVGADVALPLVVSDDLKGLAKASEFREFLKKLSLWEEASRAKDGIKERAGRGKTRGRRWIKPKSLLIVTDELSPAVRKASRNFPGVDYSDISSLNVEKLAPGGHPGRLTVWTESAFKKLGEVYD
jgi:large subunit ribosomal protein L4e